MNSISKYSNSFMTLLMLVVFTGMVLVASRYPAGARFMPFVIGFPAIALCLLQLFLDARERRRAAAGIAEQTGLTDIEKAELQVSRAAGRQITFDVGEMLLAPEAGMDPKEQLRREGIAWAYFLALVLGIVLFGFHISVSAFLIIFLRYRAEQTWLVAIGSTAAAAFVLFFAFEHLLHIPLHTGFITDRVMDLIGIGD